ncbi:MAG: hypothetical protein JWN15_2113 [Firmicutes bacterium]|nr:hypothetical protein [Bacillota bacterium]
MQATPAEIALLYGALSTRDENAWAEAWHVWLPRVATWVRCHPQFGYTGEDVNYFVGRAFEKLWQAVEPEKLERFETPAHLLHYLKLCVHSAIVNHLRPDRNSPFQATPAEEMGAFPDPAPGVEATVLDQLRRDQLWTIVASHAQTDRERVIIQTALVDGMKPRDIAVRYRGLFGGVQEVYTCKRNLLERLMRDARLQEFL